MTTGIERFIAIAGCMASLALGCGFAHTATAETVVGDITAAIRDVAGLTPTISVDKPNAASGGGDLLFDGVLSRSGEPVAWAGQRYMVTIANLPVQITYAVPDAFVPGESVVVTGLTFAQGWSTADGSGGGYVAGSDKTPAYRLPGVWTLEGSNADGDDGWAPIVVVSGLSTNDYPLVKYNGANDYYGQSFTFANWKSYRRYRITVSEATASTTYIQMSEIKLHGLYGGAVVQPAPQRIDITAAVRDAGDLRTLDVNLSPSADNFPLSAAFNGSCAAVGTERFLASVESTAATLADGGAWISYEISDSFGRNADVIATGYTFDTWTGHGHALPRMPKDWKFQAYDGNGWVTLDEWENFTMYDTVEVDSADQYAFTFNFTNSVPYRKYRFLVTRQNTDNLAEQHRAIQFSELRIWGYVDAEIGCTSIGLSAEHLIDWSSAATNKYFAPTLSCSGVRSVVGGTVTNLFNGKTADRFILNMDETAPLVVEYEIPGAFLSGRETLITNYTIMGYAGWGNYMERMPRTWKLEGWCADRLGQEAWQTLDSHTDFDGYVTDTAAKSYSASFDLSANVTSCRKYRFVFSEIKAPVNGNRQFQVAEIFLSGKWGQGISVPPDPPKGTMVIFR